MNLAFITQASAILVTMISFILFTYIEKQPLKASTVFTSIALFNQITVPLYIVPLVISMLISAIVSHRRLVKFFSTRDLLLDDTIKWNFGPINDLSTPKTAPVSESLYEHRILNRSKTFSNYSSIPPTYYFDFCCLIKSNLKSFLYL